MILPGPTAVLALVLAPGCGKLYLEPLADTDEAVLRVDDLSPGHGPTSGQTQVAIAGAGFTGDVSVRFGNGQADVTVIDANTLSVLAPDAGGMELSVDVTVASALGEVTVEGGFVYTDEILPDDTAAGIEGVGGVVEFSHLQIACTECFGNTSPEVYAFAAFHEAVESTWTGWLPSPGACVANPGNTPPVSSFLDVGQNIHLTAGSRSLTLTRTTVGGDVQYDAGSLADSDFQRNTAYDLEAADGGVWGPFTVVDAVTTGQMITSISPEQLLYVSAPTWLGGTCNRNCAFSALLSRSGATIAYGPYGGTGTFVVMLALYDGTSGNYIGAVLCRDYDNGSITIPGAYLGGYPLGTLAAVYMYRYGIEWTPNEASGSYLESVVSIGVLGTATLQ
ncbi:MAG: IPT/TIG domain-containing protein [Pseudomonadota bacterium]